MTARRRTKPQAVTIEQPDHLRHSALLYGLVRVVSPALREVGCPWQYDHARHVFVIPRQRVDDIAAALETAGHRVDIPMPGWS